MYLEMIRSHHEPGLLNIKSNNNVQFVRKEFKKRFGLQVQIFRRHGTGWVPTDLDDEVTLSELSELALLSQQRNETIIYKKDEGELP
jgi:hypothetical protein